MQFAYATRIFVGALFLLGGGAKLLNWSQFVKAVAAYKLTRRRSMVAIASGTTVAGEVLVGAGLCTGRFGRTAVLGGLLLLAVFTIVVAVTLLRARRPASCGCMVLGRDEPLGWSVCLRNLGLALLLAPTLASLPPVAIGLAGGALFVASFGIGDQEQERVRRRLELHQRERRERVSDTT
jgi:uncharacterized membrane protein YphA (DoxX/SURF4 family)